MNDLLTKNKERLTTLLLWLYIIGLVYSPFLLSISMLALFVIFLWRINWRDSVKRFSKAPSYFAICIIFLGVFVSGINSSNTQEWLHHLQLKLPFLVLPFVFFNMPKLNKEKYYYWLRAFTAFMFVSGVIVMWQYFANYEVITQKIGEGQSIPTPCSHIRYSLFMAFAAISCSITIISPLRQQTNILKYTFIGINILLILILHILSVRSGLAVLYIGYFILSFWYVFAQRRWNIAIVAFGLMILLPVLAYNFVPSFYNKVAYSKWDFTKINVEEGKIYSDSGRLYSLKAGLTLFKSSPILGTGIGDLKEACANVYDTMFEEPPYVIKYPHNQFIFTLSGMGIIGLIIFLIGLLTSFFKNKNYRQPVLFILYAIIISSFLVENTFERANGIAFFLLFLLLTLNHIDFRTEVQRQLKH